jgi:hypothetical protein
MKLPSLKKPGIVVCAAVAALGGSPCLEAQDAPNGTGVPAKSTEAPKTDAPPDAAAKPAAPAKPLTEMELLRKHQDELEARIRALETDRKKDGEAEKARLRSLRVYGDAGFRFQNITGSGNGRAGTPGVRESRFELLARIGAVGYLLEVPRHSLKYEARIAATGAGDFTAPLGAPTQGWRPVDGLGSGSALTLDRLSLQHDYMKLLRWGGGRYGSQLHGTQLVFDADMPLTGLYGTLDVGQVFGMYESSGFDTWYEPDLNAETRLSHLHLTAQSYVFAAGESGLPDRTAGVLPWGVSMQLAGKVRFGGAESSVLGAAGFHWFDGEEAIARNISTGSTSGTTTTLDSRGLAASNFAIGELYAELLLLDNHTASFKVLAHAVKNFGAADKGATATGFGGSGTGLVLGIQWGALKIDEARRFRVSYSYQYIEPDAVIPEFNHDVWNTNYKGHTIDVQVAATDFLVLFAQTYFGERVDDEINGVGVRPDGKPGVPGHNREARYRVGVMVSF